MSGISPQIDSDPSEGSFDESREGMDLGRVSGDRKEMEVDVQKRDIGVQVKLDERSSETAQTKESKMSGIGENDPSTSSTATWKGVKSERRDTLPFDPEIERTLRRLRKQATEASSEATKFCQQAAPMAEPNPQLVANNGHALHLSNMKKRSKRKEVSMSGKELQDARYEEERQLAPSETSSAQNPRQPEASPSHSEPPTAQRADPKVQIDSQTEPKLKETVCSIQQIVYSQAQNEGNSLQKDAQKSLAPSEIPSCASLQPPAQSSLLPPPFQSSPAQGKQSEILSDKIPTQASSSSPPLQHPPESEECKDDLLEQIFLAQTDEPWYADMVSTDWKPEQKESNATEPHHGLRGV
ncbi:histone-lysine N-methyltransferase 2D-like [Manihot esculenta]|uniref:histone-lysine N-methyltransferase 2D-like n=1 Tax=Manihot esculenta TaxID=3983 RepID=UPI001CC33CD8|nr:histone-lysine N-methyltransferase 2D-like [Manihot esculenta]